MTNNVSVSRTGWLIADGDNRRLEVLESPLVKSTKPIYQLCASSSQTTVSSWPRSRRSRTSIGCLERSRCRSTFPLASRNASYSAVSA